MNLLRRRAIDAVVTASLMIIPATAVAQGDAIDTAVEAVGGADALGGLSSFVVEASGQRGALDEGPTPGEGVGLASSFESLSTIDISGDNIRIDYTIGGNEFGAPREVSEVLVGDVGYFDGKDGNFSPPGTGALLSDRVVSIRTHQELLNPHLLLLDVLADPSIAETKTDLVHVAHGSTPITLTLDDETGLPKEASTLESDPLRRDVEVVAEYREWTETDSGVSFPASVTVSYDGEVVHEETRTVSTDAEVDPSLFAIPDGIEPALDVALAQRGDISHQYLQSFAAGGFPRDGLQLDVVATEVVGPGIFHITGGTHHSMAIIGDEGVVMIEAPLDETRTAAILSWLETISPGTPVTHVVQSHHHVDHSGGLRSMAGTTGAAVVAGEAAVPLYQDVFSADSEVVPDGVEGNAIEYVGVGADPVTVGSGTNAVTVYAFPNPHAEDFVLVEAGGALWVVDIFSPGTGAPLPQAIVDFVDGQDLEIFQVIGGHGGTASWEELTAQ